MSKIVVEREHSLGREGAREQARSEGEIRVDPESIVSDGREQILTGQKERLRDNKLELVGDRAAPRRTSVVSQRVGTVGACDLDTV